VLWVKVISSSAVRRENIASMAASFGAERVDDIVDLLGA
jgi:hypothetical protein